jgi:hypothetical protein
VVRCGQKYCGVVWCGVAWRGVAWRGIVWCGVAWRGVAWFVALSLCVILCTVCVLWPVVIVGRPADTVFD